MLAFCISIIIINPAFQLIPHFVSALVSSVSPSVPSATSSAAAPQPGVHLAQVLIVAGFAGLLLVIAVPIAIYKQWKKLKTFKILDNQCKSKKNNIRINVCIFS